MKIIKQLVYLPVKEDYDIYRCVYDNRNHNYHHIENLKSEEGYFFTQEQLNDYTTNVIKQALKTAVEKVNLESRLYSKFQGKIEKTENLGQEVNLEGQLYLGIEEKSITNTFEKTFNKFKV